MMILVSRTMFLGSRNQMAPLLFFLDDVDLDVTGLDLTGSWLNLTLNCLDLDLTFTRLDLDLP